MVGEDVEFQVFDGRQRMIYEILSLPPHYIVRSQMDK